MTRYDESLPELIACATELFDKDMLAGAAVLRDAGGRLSLFLPGVIPDDVLATAEQRLRDALGPYARPDQLVNDARSAGSKRILAESRAASLVPAKTTFIRLLDRRIVGADWLRPPTPSTSRQARVVFASLKGGVGRSTALCVMAAHLSRRGIRVLAVDLDFEAPGIGSMLLSRPELPRFGSVDYLVENGLSGIDADFVSNMVGSSYLGSSGAAVQVIPAAGSATLDHPADALGKISRAYLEDLLPNGQTASLSEQVAEMIDRLEATGAYDVTLIDARAGLHEATAAAILGLGANILLFGSDQPQTFQGYTLLFAHLARFAVDPSDDWRDRLNFVHAKASEARRTEGEERFRELYALLDDREASADPKIELTADDFEVDWDDAELDDPPDFEPPPVLFILDDPRFHDFDPARDPAQLDAPGYISSFSSVLEFADEIADRLQDTRE